MAHLGKKNNQRFRLIKDGHLPWDKGRNRAWFQCIHTHTLVVPRGRSLGEQQRRTEWWPRNSKDIAEEGFSWNRPESAAFLLAHCDSLIEEPLLYLYDNQSLLKAVNRWIGEGGKATLVGAPDADILAAAIEILPKRIAAGTATFLVKVKAHRGEPANEGADILADKAISDPKVGKEWCQWTNREVITWKKPCREAGKVTYQDLYSTFNNIVRDAIRRGVAENEVPKHEERLTGAWGQMSLLRQRYEKWCKGDDIEDSMIAQTSNDMRHRTKAWWRSCGRTLGLMTENSRNHVYELGQNKVISITLHMARGRQTLCYSKMKAEHS